MPSIDPTVELNSPVISDLVHLGTALQNAACDHHINDTPATLVPPGWELQLHPELRAAPARIEATVHLHTLASYIAYLKEYASPTSATFVDLATGMFRTIIDYHTSPEDPAWCAYQALYTAPRTPEFSDWHKASGQRMTQTAFAEFIEDHLPDIVEPPAAEMAEISRSLNVDLNVKFQKAIRLDNGEVQLQFMEELNGSAGPKGQLKIPQVIKLGLPLFKGGDTYAVEARFKYRIKDGSLSMWFELIRIERLIADAIEGMAAQINEHTAPGLYFGNP